MRAFDYERELSSLMTPEVTNTLSAIHAFRARQELRMELRPVELEGLREVARIQSTGASNSLENIRTSDVRLREIVQMSAQPKNRDEREIAGYRAVLDLIHESHAHISVTPNVILQLHRDLYRYVGVSFGGRWKDTDNVIAETGVAGALVTRFIPTSALETPAAVESGTLRFVAHVRAVRPDGARAVPHCVVQRGGQQRAAVYCERDERLRKNRNAGRRTDACPRHNIYLHRSEIQSRVSCQRSGKKSQRSHSTEKQYLQLHSDRKTCKLYGKRRFQKRTFHCRRCKSR